VWFARDVLDMSKVYVLKRVFASKLKSGRREVYFGELLRKEPRVCRFVEAFNRTSSVSGEQELWLVFEHEGTSLKDLLYQRSDTTDAVQPRLVYFRV
jgi:hypothetical protein